MDASLLTEKGETSGTFTVSSDGIRFVAISILANKLVFQHPWSEVLEVEVDGADELQKRVTVTRMFLVGLFAFALKKKTGEIYAYINTPTNNYLLRIPKKSAPEVRAIFGPFRDRFGKVTPLSGGTVAVGNEIPCPFCGALMSLTSVKCRSCGKFVDGREANA